MDNRNTVHESFAGVAQDLHQEQRRRWISGRPVAVADLLSRKPELEREDSLVLSLVYTEICLRGLAGDTPATEDYRPRFEKLVPQIELLIQAHSIQVELERARSAETAVHLGSTWQQSGAGSDPTELEDLLRRFGEVWREEAPPQMGSLEEVQSLDPMMQIRVLRELVLLHLEYRWRDAGRHTATLDFANRRGLEAEADNHAAGPLLEEYVGAYPQLGPRHRPDVELAVEEFRARWRYGDRPEPQAYPPRFPGHGQKLSDLLQHVREVLIVPRPGHPQDLHETDADVAVASHDTSRDGASQSEGEGLSVPSGKAYDPEAPLPYDDFRLGEQLGAGGMGTVFQAVQCSLNRPVAVKVLSKLPKGHSQAVQRFLREARSMAQMRHPNIVDIHGIGRTPDGGYFMVMDLVEGHNLHHLIQSRSVDTSDILRVATIAETIHHAHQRGVIHRDLKPSNILVDGEGRVLVTDFGLAKLLDAEDTQLSLASEPLGTPSYMAPEQASGRWGEISPRTDVYGLGGLLYALLTYQPPFTGQSHWEVLAQVVSEDAPTSPSRLSPDISPTLEEICLKCLAKDPGKRYQSAKEVADAIRGWCVSANVGPFQEDDTLTLPVSSAPSKLPGSNPTTGSSPPLGAMPLDSEFYLVRGADYEFESAISRHDSIVLIRGARQMGKTSILARGLVQARELGLSVVLIDFQKLQTTDLQTPERLFCTIGEWLADELELDVYPDDRWDSRRSASVNFERYIRRDVLKNVSAGLVWGLDEVDRLFECPFRSEVFGLFRSWHNARALQPAGPWSRLTLAMAYATEAHLFITDPNQSPFNVGTLIAMEDFTPDQIGVLNDRYGSPLADSSQVERFHEIVGGQPYLVNRGLYELASRSMSIMDFEARADQEMGIFGDHLRHMMSLLNHEPQLREVFAAVLAGNPCPSVESFYRLRSAGFVSGDYAASAKPRCQLYATYFKRHLS